MVAAAPGLAVSFATVGQWIFLGAILVIVATIVVRVVYRLVKGRSIREVVPPPGASGARSDAVDEQGDPLGSDPGEDQRR
ncbi:hypothetical protein EV140_2143 [Microcella alkaliphila]|jgi:hypothetical protein|uniref:Uncharacterized protein n=1 Tax=Microcella alkaliphila TaxID=279828 RepID=A0A4Q7TDE5_9MICO|nr:hypothetical protein [Microcella alkaliphila]RZT58374.1 hypothetical protein EV140_2143 [Microcella alkaliphila]